MKTALAVMLLFATMVVAYADESYGPDSGTPSGASVTEVKQQLEIAAANFETLSTQPASPERTQLVEREIQKTNVYLTKTNVVKQTLSKSQLVRMLKDLGYLRSGASTWGRNEVNFCLQEKILAGRTDGTTPASAEWKRFCTREELATGLSRVYQAIDGKISDHDKNVDTHAAAFSQHNADENAHGGIMAKQSADRTWLWILSALGLAAAIAWLLRRRNPAAAAAPTVFPTTDVLPPVIPGGGAQVAPAAKTGLYNVPTNTPARNGSGIQLY